MTRLQGGNLDLLKYLAFLAMLLDHVGGAFFPGLLVLRVLGRVAMPLFCLLVGVHVVRHSRDPRLYAQRLVMLGVVSQVPFTAATGLWHLNVCFTLALGVLLVSWLLSHDVLAWVAALFVVLTLGIFDIYGLSLVGYGSRGVLLVVAASAGAYFGGPAWLFWPVGCLLLNVGASLPMSILWAFGSSLAVVVAILAIWFRRLPRLAGASRGWYLVYPVHLALLALVLWVVGGVS